MDLEMCKWFHRKFGIITEHVKNKITTRRIGGGALLLATKNESCALLRTTSHSIHVCTYIFRVCT